MYHNGENGKKQVNIYLRNRVVAYKRAGLMEDYTPKDPKRRHFPMQVHDLVMKRVKRHVADLNAGLPKDADHKYVHRVHYIGPRSPSTSYGGKMRGSRPASTNKSAAHSFAVAINRVPKRRDGTYDRGYKGYKTGYITPDDVGVHPHATSHMPKHLDEAKLSYKETLYAAAKKAGLHARKHKWDEKKAANYIGKKVIDAHRGTKEGNPSHRLARGAFAGSMMAINPALGIMSMQQQRKAVVDADTASEKQHKQDLSYATGHGLNHYHGVHKYKD